MKFAVSVLLLFASVTAGPAATAPGQLERFSIAGRDYVRLSDWAKLAGFQYAWVSKTDLRLTNASARLQFTVNAQRITVNGVSVWISAPIALHKGIACISPVDLQATVHPLLWPARNKISRAKVICLDPGHGGKDTGNREGKESEKDYTLSLARELSSQLRAAGYKVFLTRSWDTFVDLDERPEIARTRKADLFISLHFNAASGGDAQGAEVYCLTPAHTASTNARGEGANTGSLTGNVQNDKNVLLAYHLQRALMGRLGMEDRGVRRARWAVLRTARVPAVLVEGGFMSNAAERKKIFSAAWRKQLAQAIVEGVKNYQKLTDAPK